MSRLLIGTSGFSYDDWVGKVYPPDTAQKDFLRLYAQIFSFTELNFTYYRQPSARTIERMLHVTDDNFTFAVKGHLTLTHELHHDIGAESKVFKEGIAPLVQAGRLGAVMMQFPFRFHYTADSRKHLDGLCRQFEGLPLAIEFRNSEWQHESVYAGLRSRGVALVNVDEPLLPNLPRPTAIATAPHAYVRFHGRNAEKWWGGDNASRYDYAYSEGELSEWMPRIRKLSGEAATVMVLFNNHWQGKAVEDAKKLKKMLGEEQ